MISDVTDEIINLGGVAELHLDGGDEHVWAGWRPATLEELVHAWLARDRPSDYEKIRGWWQPTLTT